MNQKIVAAFLLVAVTAVLAHPSIARDDALVPAVIAADVAEPIPPVSEQPEEQPTSPAALQDDAATEVAVTLPAEQEGSLPAAEQSSDNIVVPNAIV